VWQAIATGPGINAWFVPASIEPHEGGKLTVSFGDMGEETAEVTTWDPPRRLVADWAAWGSAADSALELLVEARDGGSCVVRLVHTGFGTGADWDGEYDQTTAGWAGFLHNLKIYLARFAPQPAAKVFAHGGWAGPQPAAWSALVDGLGLPGGLSVGQEVATSVEGAPQLSGVVDRVVGGTVTLVLDEPTAGYAVVAAEGPDGGVFVNLSAYLFGPTAADTAHREAPKWQSWMARNFPHPEGTGPA
jgi:uncharacterized protein YndB with AHSA1/START domain